MTNDQIREVFLANGFTIKPGETDLKPYVYAAAKSLIEDALKPGEPVAEVYQKTTGGNAFPGTAIRWLDAAPILPAGTQLYTAPTAPPPPPRLTAKQFDDLFPAGCQSLEEARAVEAAVRAQFGVKDHE